MTAARGLRRLAVRLLPGTAALTRPVFIVGCGRSGTTLLGEILDRHPDLAFVHEPRDIWRHDPRTDIWSDRAERRGGRLELTAADVDPSAAAKIRRDFALEVRLARAGRLVEKLPINAFRIGYVAGMFPDACFVHVIRNGIEVARSIAKASERGRWFGHGDYKWRLLAQHGVEQGQGRLVELCASDDLRGLLEWRLSISAAQAALAELPPARRLEVRYEGILDDPLRTCERLATFLGLAPSSSMLAFANSGIERRSAPADMADLAPEARLIAAQLLEELGYLEQRPILDG